MVSPALGVTPLTLDIGGNFVMFRAVRHATTVCGRLEDDWTMTCVIDKYPNTKRSELNCLVCLNFVDQSINPCLAFLFIPLNRILVVIGVHGVVVVAAINIGILIAIVASCISSLLQFGGRASDGLRMPRR